MIDVLSKAHQVAVALDLHRVPWKGKNSFAFFVAEHGPAAEFL